MKLLAFIFCLVISVSAWGQSRDTSSKVKLLNSATKKDTLVVIDGEPTKSRLTNIDPENIFSVTILKNDNKDPSMNPSNEIVVIIVTKQSAIKIYQKKFSAFSTKYKEYLKSHPDEKNYAYIIDGTQIDYDTLDGIKKLYELPVEKIKKISFLDGSKYSGAIKECVIITTKK